MLCPACGVADGEPSFELSGYPILGCDDCGHEFLGAEVGAEHVQKTYGDAYFSDGGSGYPDYLEMEQPLRSRGAHYARKIRQWAPGGRVLDVGCGAGFLLAGFKDEGWSGQGVEPNAKMAAYGRDALELEISEGSFEEAVIGELFDLVLLVQVVAHLFDPERSWEKLSTLIKPGGHVLVETWDRNSIAARLQKSSWHEYDPPTVLNWFTRESLAALAGRHGFQQVASQRTFKTISLAHGGSVLAHKFPALGFMKRLPSWIRVPYPGDDLFWSLFQKPDAA